MSRLSQFVRAPTYHTSPARRATATCSPTAPASGTVSSQTVGTPAMNSSDSRSRR